MPRACASLIYTIYFAYRRSLDLDWQERHDATTLAGPLRHGRPAYARSPADCAAGAAGRGGARVSRCPGDLVLRQDDHLCRARSAGVALRRWAAGRGYYARRADRFGAAEHATGGHLLLWRVARRRDGGADQPA